MRTGIRRAGPIIALAVTSGCSCTAALAVERHWLTPGGGTFHDSANWTGNSTPGQFDTAVFNLGANYAVSFTQDVLNFNSRVDNGGVTLNLSNATYSTTAPIDSLQIAPAAGSAAALLVQSGTLSAGGARIGGSGSGSLLVGTGGIFVDTGTFTLGGTSGASGILTVFNGGDVTAARGNLGVGGGSGRVQLFGAGATWNSTALLNVGHSGAGTFDVSSGATFHSNGMVLGAASGSSGVMSISFSNSTWTNTGSITVGSAGFGTASIVNLGRANVGEIFAGSESSGAGVIQVSGSGSLTATALTLGSRGAATLNINSGGRASTGATSLGAVSTARGVALVSGSGSSWTTSSLFVGNNGAGSLTIRSGADVVSSQSQLGNIPDAVGDVTVSDTGSTWNAGFFLMIGGLGRGTLSVRDGAVVTAGTVEIATSPGSTGVVTLEGAGARLNATTLSIGGNATAVNDGGAGTLTIGPSSTVAVSSLTRLRAPGALRLAGGTLLTGSFTSAGLFDFSSGTLSVSGAGLDVAGAASPLGQAVVLGAGKNVLTSGVATIASDGVMQVSGGRLAAAQINNGGQFIVSGPSSIVSANTLINNGLVRGDGAVNAALSNEAAGEVRVAAGEQLAFTSPAPSTNNGRINLLGGAAQFSGTLANSGTISGRGVLSFGNGLTNASTLSLSAGVSDVFGPVTNAPGGKSIVTGNATAVFQGDVTNLPGSEFRVSSASTVVFFGAVSGVGEFTGPGTKIFEGTATDGALTGFGNTVVGPGGAVSVTRFDERSVAVVGRLVVEANGTSAATSRAAALSVAGGAAPVGVLDLRNNDLVIDYSGVSPLGSPGMGNSIAGWIASGYAGGAWSGRGIVATLADGSSFGLGYAQSSAVLASFPATFSGQMVDDTAVLIAYTRYGDADLNGVVNLNDFNKLAANFGRTGALWTDGDFDYSGVVNLSDFNRLAANFGLSAGPNGPTPEDWSALSAAVPEPTAVVIALGGLVPLCRRRTRRSQ